MHRLIVRNDTNRIGSSFSFRFASRFASVLAMGVAASFAACSSDDSSGSGSTGQALGTSDGGGTGGADGSTGADAASCAAPGGQVTGDPDTHCTDEEGGSIVQTTSEDACHPAEDALPPEDPDADTGSDFGETMYNQEGDDDDCKYHVKWSSTPVCEGTDGVSFTVTVTRKEDGSAVTADGHMLPYIEAFLDETHPASGRPKTTEVGQGSYTIGPIVFDMPGKWTVRFHFRGDCSDALEDSPHAHAAFFVNVP